MRRIESPSSVQSSPGRELAWIRVAAIGTLLALPGAPAAPEAPFSQDLAAALREAGELARQGSHEKAIEGYRRARELAPDACFPCSLGLSSALVARGGFAEAAEAARRALAEAEEPAESAAAYNQLGISLFAGGEAAPAQIGEAVEAFRRVLEISGGEANVARYNLAEALVRLGRGAEALPLLRQFLEQEPGGAQAERARGLVSALSKSGGLTLPEFEAVTLAGETVGPAALDGKVALIDFWGTWCAPCIKALPELKALAERMKDRPFLLLSISSDRRESVLRDFVERHEMTWPQVWDRGGALQALFGVESFPTYIVIDPDGVEAYRATGWSPSLGSHIEERIERLLAAPATAATTN